MATATVVQLRTAHLNGLNVAFFNLSPMVCAATQFNDFAVYAVWSGFSEGGLFRWMDHDYGGGFWIGRTYPDDWGGGIQFVSSPYGHFITPVDAADWHISVFGRVGTVGRVRDDGGRLDSTPTVEGTQTGLSPIYLGGYNASGSYAPSDLSIAEVLMLDQNVERTWNRSRGTSRTSGHCRPTARGSPVQGGSAMTVLKCKVDGSWVAVGGTGAAGPAGVQGDPGPEGPQGIQGVAGPRRR